MDGYVITREGNREVATSEDGETVYSRRWGGQGKWRLVERAPDEPEPVMKLSVVRQKQSEGEPFHWSIFIYWENSQSVAGSVYQVKGDATYMHHIFADNIDLLNSQSFQDVYNLNEITQADKDWVRYYAEAEPAPQAETRAQVTENCQGWTMRVLEKLVAHQMVSQAWYDHMVTLMEAV